MRKGKRLLTLLKKEPGLSKLELALRMKCSVASVYRKLRLLEQEGALTFGGGKLRLAEEEHVSAKRQTIPENAVKLLSLLEADPKMGKQELAEKAGCALGTVYKNLHRLEEAELAGVGRRTVTLTAQPKKKELVVPFEKKRDDGLPGCLEIVDAGGKITIKVKPGHGVGIRKGANGLEIDVVPDRAPDKGKAPVPAKKPLTNVNLPESALRLLPHLADDVRMNKKALAERVGCSHVTVYKNLHRLEEAGLLKIGRKAVSLEAGVRALLLPPEKGLNIVTQPEVKLCQSLSMYEVHGDKQCVPSKRVEEESSENESLVNETISNKYIYSGAENFEKSRASSEVFEGQKRATGGIRVVESRGPSDTFLLVSHFVKVKMGCLVSDLSKAEAGRLFGHAKNLLSRGLNRPELEEAIDRMARDPWYQGKPWSFRAVEMDARQMRKYRQDQPHIQPLPDPMDKLLAEEGERL